MSLARLISPDALLARQQQSSCVIFDCRFALENPAYGQESYQMGHIPGALFLDLERDLSSPVQKGVTGRHPLPSPTELEAKLQSLGLNTDSEVVLYDDGNGAFAAHAWWLLLWLGKREGVYLLDGGLNAWKAAQYPLTAEVTQPQSGTFRAQPDEDLIISMPQLRQQLDQLTLLDARALPRFKGEVEPIDPIAGHIPGAQCFPFTDNLGPDGRFLPAETLKQRFSPLMDSKNPEQLVAYCGSGVTACHNLFALCLAGYPLIRLYPGSWSEWITHPDNPLAKG